MVNIHSVLSSSSSTIKNLSFFVIINPNKHLIDKELNFFASPIFTLFSSIYLGRTTILTSDNTLILSLLYTNVNSNESCLVTSRFCLCISVRTNIPVGTFLCIRIF